MARTVAKPKPESKPRRTFGGTILALALLSAALGGCDKPEDLGCGPRCEQNSLVTCDVDGDAIYTPCGDTRCADDSPVPQCVPADALPCDLDQTGVIECSNGLALMCDAEALYQLVVTCPSGELCRGDDGIEPTCVPVDRIECLTGIWVPLCIDDVEYTCVGGENRVLATPKRCPAG